MVTDQYLADCTTWTSSSLDSLKTVHSQLLTDYGCNEWSPPAADQANAAAAAQQRVDDDVNARPLPIPPLILLASMQARQDEDEGNAAARASLPPQRQLESQRGSCVSDLSICKRRPTCPDRNGGPRLRRILRYVLTCPSGMMKPRTR